MTDRSSIGPEIGALCSSRLLARLGPADSEVLLGAFRFETFESGRDLVRQGEHDRDLFILLHGAASVIRDDVELATVGIGEHIGELALIAERPRAATVRTTTETRVARLGRAAFLELCERDPSLALRFVEALFDVMGDRLTDMDRSVGTLLKARSLPPRTRLQVTTPSGRVEVRAGTPVGDLVPAEFDGEPVVAALVDRKAVSLTSLVSADCNLAPLTLEHWEGERVFLRSLSLLLLEAAWRLDPRLRLRVVQSLGFARRAVVDGDGDAEALAVKLEEQVMAIAEADTPLRELWRTVEEARADFEDRGWTMASSLLETWRQPTVHLASYGDAYALSTGACLPSTRLLRGARVRADDRGLLLLHPRSRKAPVAVGGGIAEDVEARLDTARRASQHVRRMTEGRDAWLHAMGVTSVGTFNRTILHGSVPDMVRVAEGFQEKRLGAIADKIAEREEHARIICIAGPSSSGKTTFIKRLVVQLRVNGVRPHPLSLDDYYVDRDRTPRDAEGDYDFESFDALDVPLLQRDLGALVEGQEVTTAHFDFQNGESHPGRGPTLQLGEHDVLLVEGIHGLNPRLLETLPQDRIFRIFICPISGLPFDRIGRVHVSDLRLLRRIVRDRHGRSTPAADTIARWPSVRAGERKHIFPHQHHADAVFDSALIYELSVLKVYAERYLFEVPQDHPSHTTAFRLLQLLERFVAIYPDHVPPNSIIREFIGDSGFEY